MSFSLWFQEDRFLLRQGGRFIRFGKLSQHCSLCFIAWGVLESLGSSSTEGTLSCFWIGFFAYPPETVYSFRGDMQKPPNYRLEGLLTPLSSPSGLESSSKYGQGPTFAHTWKKAPLRPI
jgi:hypothetical protein